MKVLTVVGARPQFIKSFAVSRILKPEHEEVLVHTGQHYDEELSDVFFRELGIDEPAYNLGVGSGTHGAQTGEMIIQLEQVVMSENPDLILVYGDTNSTLAGSIVGSKIASTLVHVEAGLRSNNRDMPEEINRILTDHASDILFAPSSRAANQLQNEDIDGEIHNVGDVMFDSLLWGTERANDVSDILERLQLQNGEYILSTIHRPVNTDDETRLRSILKGLAEAERPVVLPLHPRAAKRFDEYNLPEKYTDQLLIIDPVGYLDFIRLLDGAAIVATDSGGIQKEGFYLDTPCVTLRDETEWDETVEAGWNILVGADSDRISTAIREFEVPESKPQPYGDGSAAEKIVKTLQSSVQV